MTEEELREKIADVFREFHTMMDQIPPPESMGRYTYWVNRINTVFREAGYRSPEQIPNAVFCPYCDKMHWIKEPQ